MTDDHPDDELLSAHLDGEAPEVAPHLDGCAPCRARLDRLQRAAAAIGDVAAPDAGARTSAIAAAMAAVAGNAPTNVVPLRTRRPWLPAAVAVAAGVVAVGLIGPRVLDGTDAPADVTAFDSTDDDAGAERAEATAGAPAADQELLGGRVGGAVPPAGAASQAGPAALGDLGELRGRELQGVLDERRRRGQLTADPAPCGGDASVVDADDRLVEWATAREDGQAALVLVYGSPDGTTYALVTTPACAGGRRVPLG